MSDPRTPEQKRFAGYLQLVVGGLMAVLCGGCTLSYWAILFGRGSIRSLGDGLAGALFGISLVVGVLPAVAGAYVVWSGWRDLRPERPPSER